MLMKFLVFNIERRETMVVGGEVGSEEKGI